MTLEELQKLNLKLVKSRTYFRNNDEEIWPVIKRIPILEREFFD